MSEIVLQSGDDELILTLPPHAKDQTHWILDSPNNRYLEGDNWVARDWIPIRIDIEDGGCHEGCHYR